MNFIQCYIHNNKNDKKMKIKRIEKITLILTIFSAVLTYSSYGLFIWTIIEFILYLVKDKQFNWLSLILLSIVVIINVLIPIIMVLYVNNNVTKQVKQFDNSKLKSKFQQRLDEAITKPKQDD